MPRFIFFLFIIVSIAFAKTIIECRVITEGVQECDPYSKKYLTVKNVFQDKEERKDFIGFRSLSHETNTTQNAEIDFWEALEKRVVNGRKESKFKSKKALEKYIKELEKYTSQPEASKEVLLEKYIRQLEKYIQEQQKCKAAQFGIYTVEQGDVLGRIAKCFGMKTSELRTLNQLKKGAILHIGQKLKVKSTQEMVDAIVSGKYKVKPNDTLIGIAHKFQLSVKDLAKFNKLKSTAQLVEGKILQLPLKYKIGKNRYSTYGVKSLRVTATAYTSHEQQTDDTPFLAAWNNRLVPGMKSIAVSRDLLSFYGLRNGKKVRISGLPGVYRVMDKMNKRYRRRIDIYMGLDKQRALRWGRRSVKIYWD